MTHYRSFTADDAVQAAEGALTLSAARLSRSKRYAIWAENSAET
jgi:hypothetical protein